MQKIATGKNPKDFSQDDFKDIAVAVGETAILMDDQKYSIFIFGLYSRYITHWANQMKGIASDKVIAALLGLSDEIGQKTKQFTDGKITEVTYIDDCLWICLEAMVKLLASSVNFLTFLIAKDENVDGSIDVNQKEKSNSVLNVDKQLIEDLAEAVAMYSFEYARYSLLSKEQALLTEYLEGQNNLDEELAQKYEAFINELVQKSEQFYGFLNDAYNPDFRVTFIASINLAKAAGVDDGDILGSEGDVDDFFLN